MGCILVYPFVVYVTSSSSGGPLSGGLCCKGSLLRCGERDCGQLLCQGLKAIHDVGGRFGITGVRSMGIWCRGGSRIGAERDLVVDAERSSDASSPVMHGGMGDREWYS
jgi:hypothetical protein